MYQIRPLAAIGKDSSAKTRAALIEAATPLFIDLGFEATRTRDIAEKAGTNISAISYHFVNKMGLYQAAIQTQADLLLAEFPLVTDALIDATPAHRLHWLIHNLLRRVIASQKNDQLKISARELINPTAALDYLVKEIATRQFNLTKSVVADVLGREVSSDELDRFTLSVVSQCIYYGLAAPMLARLQVKIPHEEDEVDALAEHIFKFSLAGISASKI